MIKIINIKSDDALEQLTQFKNRKYVMCDVRLENVHLIKINELIRRTIFYKNDLFANSDTLWSLMQDDKESDSHNHHGLTPEDILEALNNIQDPYCVFISKYERIAIVLSCLSHYGEPLMAIIEVGTGLIEDDDANINKLITMYPKRDVDVLIDTIDPKRLLYVNRIKK